MDIKNLSEELGLEENDVLRLVRTFLASTEQDLLLLAQAIADHDADQVRKLVHHIKGAASNLELTDIADAARTIEQKGRSKSFEATEPQIAAIRRGLDSIRADMISKD